MANFNTRLTKQQIITALTKALESMSEQEVQSAISTAVSGKQDILSFDNTPTSDSSNPVTSGGIYTDQQRQEAEIGAVAAQGAKNLLKITASSQTIKGVTFTVNDDQTVTVNGTNDGTGASVFVIVPNAQAITIPDGNYILSGCPSGGGETLPYDLRWYMYSPSKSAYDSGNGASVEKSGNGAGSNIAIVVKSGRTADNLVFRPMLRRAEITDITYVPYAPTNRELYEMILALQSGRSLQSVSPASLMQAGRIDADLMDDTDNDVSETSGGEEMR